MSTSSTCRIIEHLCADSRRVVLYNRTLVFKCGRRGCGTGQWAAERGKSSQIAIPNGYSEALQASITTSAGSYAVVCIACTRSMQSTIVDLFRCNVSKVQIQWHIVHVSGQLGSFSYRKTCFNIKFVFMWKRPLAWCGLDVVLWYLRGWWMRTCERLYL